MEVGEDGALAPPPESGRRRRGRGRRKAAEEEEEEEEDMMGMSAPAAPAAQAYNQSYKYDIGLEIVSFVVIFSTCSKTHVDFFDRWLRDDDVHSVEMAVAYCLLFTYGCR